MGHYSETLNRSVPNSIPDTMTINGEDCSDRQVLADNFNDFFSTIGESNEKILLNIMGRISRIT